MLQFHSWLKRRHQLILILGKTRRRMLDLLVDWRLWLLTTHYIRQKTWWCWWFLIFPCDVGTILLGRTKSFFLFVWKIGHRTSLSKKRSQWLHTTILGYFLMLISCSSFDLLNFHKHLISHFFITFLYFLFCFFIFFFQFLKFPIKKLKVRFMKYWTLLTLPDLWVPLLSWSFALFLYQKAHPHL